jgi:site-specific DNA-adenine methylase
VESQLLQQLFLSAPAQFDRYFEPFLGGEALFFFLISVRAEKFVAYLSDINSELINSYSVVKNNGFYQLYIADLVSLMAPIPLFSFWNHNITTKEIA